MIRVSSHQHYSAGVISIYPFERDGSHSAHQKGKTGAKQAQQALVEGTARLLHE